MGDPTGFLRTPREPAGGRPAHLRLRTGGRSASRSRMHKHACRPADAWLRGAVLPRGLPTGKSDPRVERPGLAGILAAGRRSAARHDHSFGLDGRRYDIDLSQQQRPAASRHPRHIRRRRSPRHRPAGVSSSRATAGGEPRADHGYSGVGESQRAGHLGPLSYPPSCHGGLHEPQHRSRAEQRRHTTEEEGEEAFRQGGLSFTAPYPQRLDSATAPHLFSERMDCPLWSRHRSASTARPCWPPAAHVSATPTLAGRARLLKRTHR
jgi:hypothetical protein